MNYLFDYYTVNFHLKGHVLKFSTRLHIKSILKRFKYDSVSGSPPQTIYGLDCLTNSFYLIINVLNSKYKKMAYTRMRPLHEPFKLGKEAFQI